MPSDIVLDASYVCDVLQQENPTEVLLQDRKITRLGNLVPLSSLRKLDISFNELISLKGIEDLPQLRHLSAYCCRLTDVDMLSGTRRIETLMLQQNGIPSICPAFGSFNKLKELRLDRNQLRNIQYLHNCSSLRVLDLSYNHITSLEGLAGLQNLQELRVSHNCLTDLKHLRALPSLLELDISYNQIRKLSGLQLLPTIEVLHAEYNAIETLKIPQTYSHQSKKLDKSVKADDASHNSSQDRSSKASLKRVVSSDATDEGVGLAALKEAFLAGNCLTSLHGLHTLGKNLEVLDVSDNKIEESKETFLQGLSILTNLNECFIANNPLSSDLMFQTPLSPATQEFLLKLKETCPMIDYINEIKIHRLLHSRPGVVQDESIFHTWDDASAAKSVATMEVLENEEDDEPLMEADEGPVVSRNPRLVLDTMVTKEEIVLKETIFTNLLNNTKDMLVNAVKAYIDTKKTKLPDVEENINANDEMVAVYGANATVPLPEHATPVAAGEEELFDAKTVKAVDAKKPIESATDVVVPTQKLPADILVQPPPSKPPLRTKVSRLSSKVAGEFNDGAAPNPVEGHSQVLRSQSAGRNKSEKIEAKKLVDEVLVQTAKISKPLRKSNSARIERDKSTDDVKFKSVVRGGSFSIGVGSTGSSALFAKPLDRKSGIEADNDDASIQWAMLPPRAKGEGQTTEMKEDDSDDEEEYATLLTEMNLETQSTALNWEDLGTIASDADSITEKDLASPRYIPATTAELTKPPSKSAVAKPLRHFKIPNEAKTAIAKDKSSGCSRHG